MFFTDDLLTKKQGNFGLIWLAATLGPRAAVKRISRKQLASINLTKTCDLIADPPEPLALRLSGCLLVGVARVYNSSYEMFFADVNNFHSQLRRAIITDFTTSTGAIQGEVRGLDLPGGGKSKFDAITFGGLELGWQADKDWDFQLINWNDPLRKPRKRRASSKLESLQSQASTHEDDDDEEDEDEDELDDELEDDDLEEERVRAPKRPKTGSSPYLTRPNIQASDPTGPFFDDDQYNFEAIDLGLGLEVDLDLGMDGGGGDDQLLPGGAADSSFTVPGDLSAGFGNGMDMDIDMDMGGEGGMGMDVDMQGGMGDDFALGIDPTKQSTPNSRLAKRLLDDPNAALRSAIRKARGDREDSDDSLKTVEEALAVVTTEPKKARVRKPKNVRFDKNIEEEYLSNEDYLTLMNTQNAQNRAKEQEKVISKKATEMVDGAGGWMTFFDPEMNDIFSELTKAPQWKWEKDLAASKEGREMTPESERPAMRRVMGRGEEEEVIGQGGMDDTYQGYGGMDDMGQNTTWDEVPHDMEMPMPSDHTKSRRIESENPESELGRFAGSQGIQSQLPWDAGSGGDDGYFDVQNSSFTPGSIKLSLMTPQEARIRRLVRSSGSQHGSSQQVEQGRARLPSRSRSASVLAERAGAGEMLFPGQDSQELPDEEFGFEVPPSQAWRNDLPAPFRPEFLATLEKSCRNFLSFAESKMNEKKDDDEIEFDDLVGVHSKKKVAAAAFYNCLTLATKKIFKVDQSDHWDSISIKLAATAVF